ncbi:MAG: hypothetical protein Fur0022_07850 [Anaerolineales bacterium]
MKISINRLSAWFVLGLAACIGLFVMATSFTPAVQAEVASSPAGSNPDISLENFAGGLSAPVDIANAGDTRLFVVEQAGIIRIVESDGTVLSTPFLNIMDRVEDGGEQGLLGLAFDPNYATNGYFYVNYTYCTTGSCPNYGTTPNLYTRVSRFTVTGDPNLADPNSEVILLVIQQPYGNHNGGDINFGPDGYLYIGMGDGGDGGDPQNHAQNPASLLGKMLRIDIDGGGQPPDCDSDGEYTIPADNPFIGVGGTCDEIWHFGLRNPWRFSFDSLTGDMYIADVGQNAWEEVNFQPAASLGGENWGWRCYEGNHPYNTSGCGPMNTYDFPFHEYAHGASYSITGGFVYRGGMYPVFYGHYIFTDYGSGQVWTAINNGGWVITPQGDLGSSFTSFGEGADGEIYLATLNGNIYHVVENTVVQTQTPTATTTNTPTATTTPTATQTPSPTITLTPSNTPTNTPTPTPTLPINLTTVATGFFEPVDVENAGDERLFVAERGGLIHEVSSDGTVLPDPILAITDQVSTDYYQQGLLSFVFDPNFSTNGYLYTHYNNLDGDITISRFTVSGTISATVPLTPIDPATELVILTIPHPNTSDENSGGELAFGPDGYLYISLGDGGVHENALDGQSLLGKILRLDVHGGGQPPDCGSGPYTIPADNPFTSDPQTCDEIWNLGLRNPWRYSFDSLTGDLYIGDVGEWVTEEINFQNGASTGGENYGWSCYEGSGESSYYSSTLCIDTYTFPIHEYNHSVGYAVVGGYVYRGCNYADMYGKYYFADYVYGNLWSLVSDGHGGYSVETLLSPAPQQLSSFGQGADGELYVLGYDLATDNGSLYHLAGHVPGECFAFSHTIWIPTVFKP